MICSIDLSAIPYSSVTKMAVLSRTSFSLGDPALDAQYLESLELSVTRKTRSQLITGNLLGCAVGRWQLSGIDASPPVINRSATDIPLGVC
jgi:hypothetical protein